MKDEKIEGEFPRKGSSHNGTSIGYSVEVRYNFPDPAIINGMLLSKTWKKVHFDKVQPPFGVPNAKPWNSALFGMLDLYDYCAAQALRWWFHANADQGVGAMCLESRIVAHKITYSQSEEAISAHAAVSGEDRTSIVPDWNTPKQPA